VKHKAQNLERWWWWWWAPYICKRVDDGRWDDVSSWRTNHTLYNDD